jgi:hypothetical protein
MAIGKSGGLWRSIVIGGAVPAKFLLIYVTQGACMPHLPRQGNTWNIQYAPLFLVGLLCMVLAVIWRNHLGRWRTWSLAFFNGAIAVLAVYALVTLWGEKY